jgi:hypothetical protein
MAALAGVLIMVWGSLGTPNHHRRRAGRCDGHRHGYADGADPPLPEGADGTGCGNLRRHHWRSRHVLFTDPMVASARDLWILAGFGLAFAAAHIMLTEGARLIPAARTGLVGTLETPLAPIWAWLILSELPPFTTWIGGAVVLFAVIWNLRRER